jgi:hypothetical protein
MNKHDVNAAVLAAQGKAEGALTIYELECLGYIVNTVAHAPGLESKFRWTNTHTFESQIEVASDSEAQAWARAAQAWVDKHQAKGVPGGTRCGELTPTQLEGHYSHGGANGGGQHPVFTRADWRHAVGDGETVTGYWVWLASEIGQSKRHADKHGLRQAQRQRGWLGVRH